MATTVATRTVVLEIRLLGGFSVAVGDRGVPDAAWQRKRVAALVKLLALEPSHRLHREQVMEALWPELDPVAADNNLRFTLFEARKRLVAAGAGRNLFLARAGESLVLGPDESLTIDVDGFERAANEAWLSSDLAAFQAAIARYAGDLLPEDPYEDWIESRRAALRAAYLSLLRRLADLHLHQGAAAAAIAALERLAATEPSDEPARTQLMRALAQSGQRQRALAHYAELEAALGRDVGAEPEPATRRLRDDIRDHRYPPAGTNGQPDLVRPSPADTPLSRPAVRHVLPAPLDALIGREREVAEVGQLLSSARLVTLTGPGGVGKTRLALVVAHAAATIAEDAIFVDLTPVRDPALVLPTIAGAMGLQETRGDQVLPALTANLGSRRILLVIDNLEQVVTAAPVIGELLARCRGVKVLATSRVRLRLRGEREYPVGPLPPPAALAAKPATALDPHQIAANPAVALFVERAQAVKPTFALTVENVADVAAICRKLDGLPLALELAAAWVKLLPPAAMHARLQSGRLALTGGARDLPERQRTIRATIAWSYDLLAPAEQRLFRRLAVFSGGWTVAAAVAVGSVPGMTEPDILDGLRALVEQNLVVEQAEASDESRLAMLETIREFGLEQLAASGDTATVRDAHAAYFLALAREAAPWLEGERQAEWVRRLKAEHPNVRATIAWLQECGQAEAILQLGADLWLFWFNRYAEEGLPWLEQSLAAATAAEPLLRAAALHGAGNMARSLDDPARGQALHLEELTLRRASGDETGIDKTLLVLGVEALEQEDFSLAESLVAESAARLRQSDYAWALAIALDVLSSLASTRGEGERARMLATESLAIARAIGDDYNIAQALTRLGDIHQAAGETTEAADLYEASLTLTRPVEDPLTIAVGLGNLAGVAIARGDLGPAEARLAEAHSLRQEDLPLGMRAWLLLISGRLARLRGEWSQAAMHDRAALDLVGQTRSFHQQHVADCLDEVAAFAAATGEPATAGRLWGAADGLRGRIGLWWRRDAELTQVLTTAREAMGEQAWMTAWDAGRAMSAEQALAEGLAVVNEYLERSPSPAPVPSPEIGRGSRR